MGDVSLQISQLLLVVHRILLQCGQRGLVLLLQLALLLNLSRNHHIKLFLNFAMLQLHLLLKLLIKLLKLLELCELLRVLLKGRLKLGLLGSLAVNLARGLGLGSLTRRDVGQATSCNNECLTFVTLYLPFNPLTCE